MNRAKKYGVPLPAEVSSPAMMVECLLDLADAKRRLDAIENPVQSDNNEDHELPENTPIKLAAQILAIEDRRDKALAEYDRALARARDVRSKIPKTIPFSNLDGQALHTDPHIEVSH